MGNGRSSEDFDYIDPKVYRFGEYILDARHHKREIRYKGQPRPPLTGQEYSVLTFLISKRGDKVAADDFPHWKKTDLVLGKPPSVSCISRIRTKLGEESKKFIKNTRHSGYWFAGELFEVEEREDSRSALSHGVRAGIQVLSRFFLYRWKLLSITSLLVGLVSVMLWRTQFHPAKSVRLARVSAPVETKKPSNLLIVAHLDGPQGDLGLTDSVIRHLKYATKEFGLRIQPLEETIKEGDGSAKAMAVAERDGAIGTIWGHYTKVGSKARMYLNFDVPRCPCSMRLKRPEVYADIELVNSPFRLNDVVEEDLAYVSLLLIGATKLEQRDYPSAIKAFDAAESQLANLDSRLVDVADLFELRGESHLYEMDLPRARADFERALQISNRWEVNNDLGATLLLMNDSTQALQQFRKAESKSPLASVAFMNEGAILADRKGSEQEAIRVLSKSLSINPNQPWVFYYRAKAWINEDKTLVSKDHLTAFLTDIKKAIELDQSESVFQYALGLGLTKVGDYAGAVRAYDAALSIKPDWICAQEQKATTLRLAKQTADADQALSRISSFRTEDDLYSLFDLGNFYLHSNQFQAAVKIFGKITEKWPNFFAAYHNLGTAQFFSGNDDDAIANFDKTIKLNPQLEDAYLMEGQAFLHKKDYSRAKDRLLKALSMAPHDAVIYLLLGRYYRKVEDNEAAIKSFKRAIQLHPDFAEALTQLGDLNQNLGRYKAAEAQFTRALAIGSSEPVFLHQALASIQLQLHHFSDALGHLNALITLSPNNLWALRKRALLVLAASEIGEVGDFDQVIRDFERLLTLGPEPLDYSYLGLAYWDSQGDRRRAQFYLDKAIELDPRSDVALHNRAHFYWSLGDQVSAIRDLTSARWATKDAKEIQRYRRDIQDIESGNILEKGHSLQRQGEVAAMR